MVIRLHKKNELAAKQGKVTPRRMTPEERVRQAIHMSSVAARISIDSIRDQHPEWSERKVLEEARRRIALGRRVHPGS